MSRMETHSLHVGEENLEFNCSSHILLTLEDACYQVDILEIVLSEEMVSLTPCRTLWRLVWLTLLNVKLSDA